MDYINKSNHVLSWFNSNLWFEFSLEKKSQLEHVFEISGVGDFLYRYIKICESKGNPSYLSPSMALPQPNESASWDGSVNIMDLMKNEGFTIAQIHLVCQEIIDKFYSPISDIGHDRFIEDACNNQIAISDTVAMKNKGLIGIDYPFRIHNGFKRLAIIRESERRYSDVVDLCSKAKSQGWLGDWDKRIARCQGKVDDPRSYSQKVRNIKNNRWVNHDASPVDGVPPFDNEFQDPSYWSGAQKSFYDVLKRSLDKNLYLPVGQWSAYCRYYVLEIVSMLADVDLPRLRQRLLEISALYREDSTFKAHCEYLAHECLLCEERYEEYLEKTAPQIAYGKYGLSWLRLNIQRHIGHKASPLDVVLMVGKRRTRFVEERPDLYITKLESVFDDFSGKNGDWHDLLRAWIRSGCRPCRPKLFARSSLPHTPTLSFDCYFYGAIPDKFRIINDLDVIAENLAREELGVPRIGEGWVSETILFNMLKNSFHTTKVIQHGRPEWLGRQHFDVWLPEWNIAVEYHGEQHFIPVDFFGGEVAHQETVIRDARKTLLAKQNNVTLFVVKEGDDYDELVKRIESLIGTR